MGRPPKIDLPTLERMINTENKTPKEASKFFGVSAPAISRALKKLKIAVVKNVAAEHAPTVVAKKINQIEQLQNINEQANFLLTHMMSWIKGNDTAIQVLEGRVRKINVGTKGNPKYVDEFKFKDPHEIALRAMAEIRNQLGLQLEIFKTLYDVETVKEFMQEIIDFLSEIDPKLREQFIEKVRNRRDLYFSVQNLRN